MNRLIEIFAITGWAWLLLCAAAYAGWRWRRGARR